MPRYSEGTPKIKDRRFVNEYIKHGNGTQAALYAYTSNPKSAAATAYNKLHQPKIQQAIKEALLAEGLTPQYVANKRKALLDKTFEGIEQGDIKLSEQGIYKNLEAIDRMLVMGERQGGNSLHVHMNLKPLSEVKAHAKELDGYFKGILEDGDIVE